MALQKTLGFGKRRRDPTYQLDRLLHRAEVVVIRGDRFRAQERKRLEQEVLLEQV